MKKTKSSKKIVLKITMSMTFGVRQLGSCPLPTAAQPPLVGLNLGPKDGQLDLEVINLEDGCQYLTKSVKDCKRHLSAQFIHLDSIGQHPAVHDILPTGELGVLLP